MPVGLCDRQVITYSAQKSLTTDTTGNHCDHNQLMPGIVKADAGYSQELTDKHLENGKCGCFFK